MSSTKDKIRALVESFVGSLDHMIRQAALEAAQESLGLKSSVAPAAPAVKAAAPKAAARPKCKAAPGPAKAAKPSTPAAPAPAGSAAPAPKAAAKSRRKKGEKRSPKEIAKLTEDLLAAVTAKPGQRMEHLGKALGASTAELQIPVARLVEDKKITRKGEKRATTYFPAK
jgi:hypothetical protein